jgi:hypothetical protein
MLLSQAASRIEGKDRGGFERRTALRARAVRATLSVPLVFPPVPVDGRLRISELTQRFDLGPLCIFDITGNIDAYLQLFCDIELDLGLFSITLVDEENKVIWRAPKD